MQTEVYQTIVTTVKQMWATGEQMVASGANRRALLEYATGCYWSLVNMQHAAVFGGTCDESAMWADTAAIWLNETMGL